MATYLRYPKGYQFFDANGQPFALAQLWYYQAGSTAAQNTYADAGGTTANPNPIVLDGSGRLDTDIYLGASANYKEVLTDQTGAVISPWPDDNIPAAVAIPSLGIFTGDTGAGGTSGLVPAPPAGAAAAGNFLKADGTWTAPPAPPAFAGDFGNGGEAGLVPAPAAGDAVANMFLSANGSWATPPGASASDIVTLVTSAATASGAVLTFASVPPAVVPGMLVLDETTPAVIPTGTMVKSVTATAVTLTASVTGAGVASGDSIVFNGAAITNLTLAQTASNVSIGSSTGTGVTVPAATSTNAGVLDSTRAAKIDGLAAVASSGNYADLSGKPAAFTGDTGSGGTVGFVPAPAAGTAAAGKYLKADGTWSVPAGSGGGSSSPMTGATSSAAGTAGTVPAPATGQQGYFLRGDATWEQMTAAQVSGLATVATSGSYTDLSNKPSIPAAQVNSDWNASSGVAQILNKPSLATVATSGSYSDLSNKPSIPSAQVQTDWNASSGLGVLLNKPALGTAAALNVPASGNASTSQIVYGTDTRLSDSRIPQAHASTHAAAGSDAISISASQVSGIPASLATQNLDNIGRLGIGTTDTNNNFSFKGPTALFASTGDMRATISKGATSNTAAFNFQDNYSTRVQFGLLGNDSFTVATSPDGSTFNNAIVATTAGAVSFPNTGGFTGDSGSGGSVGLVPAPASGTAAAGKFLKADGTWSVPSGTTQVNSDWNATSGVAQILNKPTLATVATSGSYTNLSNQPTLGSLAALSSVNNSNWSGTALAIGNGGTGQTTSSAAFNALSPTTALGDLIVGGTSGAATRLGVGANGYALLADSTQTTGVKWGPISASAGGSSGQLQVNSSGSLAGASALTYAPSGRVLSIAGALFVGDNSAAPANNSIIVGNYPNGTATRQYQLGNGAWYSTPVPYLRAVDNGASIAFDIMPNTTAANVWIDICSTDIVSDSANFETLNLKKLANGDALVGCSAAGTGTVRNLLLQSQGGNAAFGTGIEPKSLVDIAGNLAIGSYAGSTAAPTNGLIVSGLVGIGTNTPHAALALDVNGIAGSGATSGNGEFRAYRLSATDIYMSMRFDGSSPYEAGLYYNPSPYASAFYAIQVDSSYDTIVNCGSGAKVELQTGGTLGLTIDNNQNVIVGKAALATSATNGFLYVPTCAGAPTGTPTSVTGAVPLVFDAVDEKLYLYNGGWKAATLS